MKTAPPTVEDSTPDRNYLMVKPELEPSKSEGGIIIPDQARKATNEGEIIKCGHLVPDYLKPGMRIVFTQSSEYQLKMDDGSLVFVVSADNVLLYRDALPMKKVLFPAKTDEAKARK